MDWQPVNSGHVRPRRPSAPRLLDDLDEDLGVHMYRVPHRLPRALRRSGLPCEGVDLLLADGEAAFREIPHVHLHVCPRTTGDAFRIEAEWRRRDPDERDDAAAQVGAGLAALHVDARDTDRTPHASESSTTVLQGERDVGR